MSINLKTPPHVVAPVGKSHLKSEKFPFLFYLSNSIEMYAFCPPPLVFFFSHVFNILPDGLQNLQQPQQAGRMWVGEFLARVVSTCLTKGSKQALTYTLNEHTHPRRSRVQPELGKKHKPRRKKGANLQMCARWNRRVLLAARSTHTHTRVSGGRRRERAKQHHINYSLSQ